jgi:limonene-1,2-epoxide hydrolase
VTESAESLPAGPASHGSPAEVVTTFLTALAEGDAERAIELVADDLVYQNVSLPTIRGKRRFAKGLADFNRRGIEFDVRIHRITQDGSSVMTERTDGLRYRRFYQQFWVCGVFEVHDGRITLWRDYFDWRDIAVSAARGLAAVLIPRFRAQMPDS